MTITPIKKRKVLMRRHGKLVEKETTSFVIPHRTNIIDNISKELEEYKKRELEHITTINELNLINIELNEKLSNNILNQQIEQYKYEIKQYEFFCFKENRDIKLTVCSNRINRNICSNECKTLKNKLQSMNLI